MIRLVDTLVQVSWSARNRANRDVLPEYPDRIAASAEGKISEPQERQIILERVRGARAQMGMPALLPARKRA